MGLAATPIVGREAELDVLEAGLAGAVAGRGSLSLVVGEAGIGKTTLVRAVAKSARARGIPVWWAGCQADGAPPYWPWVQLVRAAGRVPAELEVLAAGEGNAVDEGARFLSFDRVARLFLSHGPALAVLDDLHAASADSIRLLEHVATEVGRSSIAVVATMRATPDPLVDAFLVSTAREPTTVRVDLLRLSDDAIAELGSAAGLPPDRVGTLVEHATGHPLYARELIRMFAGQRGSVTIPTGVRQIARAGLERLSASDGDLLLSAALAGDEIDVELVEALGHRAVAACLARAAAVGLVVHDDPARWSFGHRLVREAIVDVMPASERGRRHAAIAAALDARPIPPAHSVEHHRLASAEARGDADAAIVCAIGAADRCIDALAFEEAVELYERAIAWLDRLSDVEPSRRCDLLIGLGRAHVLAGSFFDAQRVLVDAARLAGDDAPRVARALALIGDVFSGPYTDAPLDLLLHGLSLLADDDHRGRVPLLVRLANSSGIVTPESRELYGRAVAEARLLDDPELLVYALCWWWRSLPTPEHLSSTATVAVELDTALARCRPDAHIVGFGTAFRAGVAITEGDRRAVGEHATRASALADAGGRPQPRAVMAVFNAAISTLDGDFAVATERLRSATSLMGRHDTLGLQRMVAGNPAAWWLRRQRGEDPELVAEIEDALRSTPLPTLARAVLSLALADADRFDDAGRVLDAALAPSVSAIREGLGADVDLCLLAEAAAMVSDERHAAAVYDALAPRGGRSVCVPAYFMLPGAADLYLGMLAALVGRLDDAERHYEIAIVVNERMGSRPALARTWHWWSRLHAHRGDRVDARRCAERARSMAQSLGMTALARHAGEVVDRTARSTVQAAGEAVFRRDGETWFVAFDGTTTHLRDTKGMAYLAELLRSPGREHHVLAIVGASSVDAGATGPLLDAEAKAAYRERMAELTEEIEDADRNNDPARSEAAAVELDALVQQLTAAVGRGGRDRTAGPVSERARVGVTRAVRTAIARIHDVNPALGHHLSTTVRTGTYCAYEPDPRAPIAWQVDDQPRAAPR